jgi:hypothetical protein
VVAVNDVLHFRLFDAEGKMVVDRDETMLTDQAEPIKKLREQLESLWPPHELTATEKEQILTAVSAIVGRSLAADFRPALRYQTPYHWTGAYGLVVLLLLGLALFRPKTDSSRALEDLPADGEPVPDKEVVLPETDKPGVSGALEPQRSPESRG